MDITDFHFTVFNPRTESDRYMVNKCYELWLNVWRETIKELDGVNKIHADDFDRQDEVYVLWHNEVPVAMMFYRYRDLRLEHIRNDSYFRCWSEDDMRKLSLGGGSKLAIGGQGTVHPAYRKLAQGSLPIKELIVYNSLMEVVATQRQLDVIVGTVRNNKGMNKLIYNCGFSPVKKDVLFHNVPVDLVVFYPKRNDLTVPPDCLALINKINSNSNRSRYGYSRAA